ncbi:MAG: hypothetical protein QNL96_10060 [SAR86 cluster bacterium]|jgi:hypothetical protein
MADYVAFRDRSGIDGFIEIAASSELNDKLVVIVCVDLLLLRRRAPFVGQFALMGARAPGRLLLGVGMEADGGHDYEASARAEKYRAE